MKSHVSMWVQLKRWLVWICQFLIYVKYFKKAIIRDRVVCKKLSALHRALSFRKIDDNCHNDDSKFQTNRAFNTANYR